MWDLKTLLRLCYCPWISCKSWYGFNQLRAFIQMIRACTFLFLYTDCVGRGSCCTVACSSTSLTYNNMVELRGTRSSCGVFSLLWSRSFMKLMAVPHPRNWQPQNYHKVNHHTPIGRNFMIIYETLRFIYACTLKTEVIFLWFFSEQGQGLLCSVDHAEQTFFSNIQNEVIIVNVASDI